MFALEPSKKTGMPSRIRHDRLDNPKTQACSSLSRIAIYHAPIAAKTCPNPVLGLPKGAETGQVGQMQGRFKIESALISSKLAQLWTSDKISSKLSSRPCPCFFHIPASSTTPAGRI